MSHADRFWRKVARAGDGDCWLWEAAVKKRCGYGSFWLDGRTQMAHRVAYELVVGPIPDGLQLDHLCKVRKCVNPAHLEAVTCGENIRRGDTGKAAAEVQSSKTHCPQGHPYSGDNLAHYRGRHGRRYRACRICRREAMRRFHAKKEVLHERR